MDKLNELLAKIEELKESSAKAFEKGNKAQAKKARQQTMEIRTLINDLRVELLAVYAPKEAAAE
jgi:hypothetical protein